MIENLFETISQRCDKKRITKLCNKLIKKCSFTKSSDVVNLCELAYWLYIYGYEKEALMVCEQSHIEDPIPLKVNYNVWDFIIYIWGLEAYILKEQGFIDSSEKILNDIKRVRLIPSSKIYDTVDKMEELNKTIANRLTYNDVTYKSHIDAGISPNEYRFIALYKMIGYGITETYPELVNNNIKLQKDIEEYKQILVNI